MRALLAAFALALPAAAATPQFELQAGGFHGLDFDLDPAAAEVAVRAGVDLADRLTFGVRAAGILGSSVPEPQSPFALSPGVRGWQALVEARVHSSGVVQASAAAGIGIAQLSTWQVNRSETTALHGDPAFTWRLALGLRFGDEVAASIEGAISQFRGLRPAAVPGQFQEQPSPVTALSILAGIAFRI